MISSSDRNARPGVAALAVAACGGGEKQAAAPAAKATKIAITATGDARAEVYCYEPSWHHGNAVVEWPV